MAYPPEKGRIPADIEMDLTEAAARQSAFPALYRGVCIECEERFPADTMIRKKKGYGYVHDVCPEAQEKRQPFAGTSTDQMGY